MEVKPILEFIHDLFLRFSPTLVIGSSAFISYQFFRVSFEMHKNKIAREKSVFYMGIIILFIFIYIFLMESRLDMVINPYWLSVIYFICSFFWWVTSLLTEKYLPDKNFIDIKLYEFNGNIAKVIFFISIILLFVKTILRFI